MARIVKQGIFDAVAHAVKQIKYGKPIPTILGALIGGSIGATLGLLTIHLLPFGIGIGLLVGAAVAASYFRRTDVAPLPVDDAKEE